MAVLMFGMGRSGGDWHISVAWEGATKPCRRLPFGNLPSLTVPRNCEAQLMGVHAATIRVQRAVANLAAKTQRQDLPTVTFTVPSTGAACPHGIMAIRSSRQCRFYITWNPPAAKCPRNPRSAAAATFALSVTIPHHFVTFCHDRPLTFYLDIPNRTYTLLGDHPTAITIPCALNF